jgi:hypothetical protein
VLIGTAEGSRLAVRSASIAVGTTSAGGQQPDAFVELAFEGARFVVAPEPGEADEFLASLIGEGGLAGEFSFGVRLSGRDGLRLTGAAGLEATLPLRARVGPVELRGVTLALRAGDRGVDTVLGVGVRAAIGPVTVAADPLGLRVAMQFVDPPNGNLGPVDAQAGFLPPSGIGLTVDAGGVVRGGGLLFRDGGRGLYAGALELTLHERIALKAIGLIATRLPDGSKGYSLLVFITAEGFKPVPLGLGFTLQGIGGMVAVNRTFDVEVLRRGLSDGSSAAVLFPKDPVGNAAALIRTLDSAFPARRGAYLLGLLVRIGWGTPTLVRIDVALILELGARRRLLLLGRVSTLLPSEHNDLVRLQMDALGVVDFDAGTAEVDAVLVDSRLAHRFAVTGAAVLRARWGSAPGFLLALGGFHPRFDPPAGVPKVQRLAIALAAGDNPRLTCAAYFAVTANTVQYGASAQLYAAAAGFSVQGEVGYDVLVELHPLHFVADFRASLQLKRGSTNLFKVSLSGELEGPRPLRVSGKASFEILWCDFSVRFDKTLVAGERPPLPPAVDVQGELKRVLAEPGSWRTVAGASHGVALREAQGQAIVLDPLGRVQVRQQLVPLNEEIERFGGAPPAGARRFELTASIEGSAGGPTQAVREEFAPAQYFELSDDERLAAPSFQEMDAGVVFGAPGSGFDARELVAADLEYEQIVVDEPQPPQGEARPKATVVLQELTLQAFAASGAAANAATRTQGRARFRQARPGEPMGALNALRYAVVPLAEQAAGTPQVLDFAASRAALGRLNRAGARWQAVPAFEVAE